jgi:hypothetical protein
MQGWLRKVDELIRNSLSREPTIPLGRNSASECLPPVFGPSDWSDGLMAVMADRGAAWYFDRH